MKNILVIGANSFIAKEFVNRTGLAKTSNFLLASRSGETHIHLDFSDYTSIDNIAKLVYVGVDGILFFQGINPQKNTKETDSEHVLKMMEVNILGPIMLIKSLANKLNANASIIFFTSIAAKKGSYDPAYAAAKSAINGLLISFANEFSNFRFNAISLGLVEGSPVFKGMTPDFIDKHRSKMYNNKLIKITNVVSVIDELISNDNLNKETINLDGGFSL